MPPRKKPSRKAVSLDVAESPGGSLLDLEWHEPPHILTMVHDRYPAVWILGYRMQEVVGEHAYQHSLDAAVWKLDQLGRAKRSGQAVLATSVAWLVEEPTNPVDPLAVAVYLENVLCGYLSTEARQRWGPRITQLQQRYGRKIACTAVIVGKYEGLKGVWLMLDTGVLKPKWRTSAKMREIFGDDDLVF